MPDQDDFTSPLDDVEEESDYRLQLPAATAYDVVLVDDDKSARLFDQALLEASGYVVHAFVRPSEALEFIEEGVPMVLVTDFDMPEMTGLELATRAHEIDPDMKVILLTGSGDERTAQEALRAGISDYIKKPPDPVALARSVQRAVHERAAEEHHREMVSWMKLELDRREKAIEDVTLGTLGALANALDMRNPHFHGHSRAVAMQAAAVAEAIGLDPEEVEAVRVAGLLHDVGMMAIPDRLVEKEGALTDEEYAVIRTHPDRGVEILEPMNHLGNSVRYIHEHHERIDGSGYPLGKKGEEISLGGQIVGISEAWIAILESRDYREKMSREEGIRLLQDRSGEWFSEEVTTALVGADVGVI